jgi:S1/P1 Nuclease
VTTKSRVEYKPIAWVSERAAAIYRLGAQQDFNGVSNTEAKALAMSWVIHLMGDLHQPMHVTDRGDRGGNEFKVTINGRTRCRESNSSGTKTKVELHSVWDSCLVFTLESGRTFDKHSPTICDEAGSGWPTDRASG